MRQRTVLDPFPPGAVLTPELLKLKSEWMKQRSEVALQEQHRLRAGDEFDYEPETLPWCAAWTEKAGTIVDPVTGKRGVLYALCARRNGRGDCALFDRK